MRAAPPEGAEHESSPVLTGIGLGPAFFKGDAGYWLEAFVGHDFPLSRSLALRATVGPLLTGYSEAKTFQTMGTFEDYPGQDDVSGLGIIARGLVEHAMSETLRLHAGLLAGGARIRLESNPCGDATLDNFFHGLSVGAAARFSRVEVGILGDIAAFPKVYCAESIPPEIHRRDELSFDDPTVVLSGRLQYHW